MRIPVWRISRKTLAAEIIAAEQFLLEDSILLDGQRPWQALRNARNVLATDQMSQIGKLLQSRQVRAGCSAEGSAD